MVLRSIFPAMFTAPDDAPPRSRDATLYMWRCVFFMGIRTPPKRFYYLYCLWSLLLNTTMTLYQPVAFWGGLIKQASTSTPGEFLTSMQVSFNVFTLSLKVVWVWVYIKNFDVATNVLDELDKAIKKPLERRQLHQAVARSNAVFFIFMFVYMAYTTNTFIVSVFNGRPSYQNFYPFLNWREGRWQFWVQALFEYFGMATACFQDVCLDCYPVNYAIPLRAHMAILADRLRNLGHDPKETHEERLEELENCIKHHKTILRFCDALRPLVSFTIFMQFIVVGMVLGCALINIVMFADFASAIAILLFMMAVLLETTPFCGLCNYITDDCNKLADALFEANWMDAEPQYKKTLMFFLHNLQQPIVFMAMNVIPISMGSNISVSKFAFSVFTLVKQMNIAEKIVNRNVH